MTENEETSQRRKSTISEDLWEALFGHKKGESRIYDDNEDDDGEDCFID